MTDRKPPAHAAIADRRRRILDLVIEQGSAQIDALAARFGTSRMTIHRDLNVLAAQGLARKVHGGITALSNGAVESGILHRIRRAASEKRAIGALAATLIAPGDVIALDDSTTARCLSERLSTTQDLTVVTNSLGIAALVARFPGCRLIALGGRYHPTFDACFGLLCEQAIASLRVQTAFLSASAIAGMTAYHQEEDVVKAKLALMRIAERRVLMVDSSKFGANALSRLAPLAEFDVVISDGGLDAATRRGLLDAGVRLMIADTAARTGSLNFLTT